MHGASFEGPHIGALAVDVWEHAADAGRLAPHHADGHIDHAADRPRSVALDDRFLEPASHFLEPGTDCLAVTPASAPGTGGAAPRDPPGVSRSPYCCSALALHCVWRQ
ncbi:hypothetical protein [Streptomyces sp. HUAS TT20]|uniref:hypothetical protein n=1 Tax=Streptomyces sp. HUAS TT20 TaxID=3447509 RepID=UPI0021D9D42E|nr:hypothetical protein [Streptomyces sp. HUAS 15-9]UXY30243.1 hypothetical protein N8I87_29315 [Streptomyces sp. HUAS 15-9]